MVIKFKIILYICDMLYTHDQIGPYLNSYVQLTTIPLGTKKCMIMINILLCIAQATLVYIHTLGSPEHG